MLLKNLFILSCLLFATLTAALPFEDVPGLKILKPSEGDRFNQGDKLVVEFEKHESIKSILSIHLNYEFSGSQQQFASDLNLNENKFRATYTLLDSLPSNIGYFVGILYKNQTGHTVGATTASITIGNAKGDIITIQPTTNTVLKAGQRFTINWIAPPNFYPKSTLISLILSLNSIIKDEFVFLTGSTLIPLSDQKFDAVVPATFRPDRGCNIFIHIHNETTGAILAFSSNAFTVI
ncbi:5833_t:CDS:2 [Ambispora gerdemannii]|uniref:5833_t:CDS:1 n=1 Tax=Ambispora gerdemannii TaxID=144530 RepID=A0A9N8YY97_9GLOM|nr:5833_t:CDS:2 [Ambispora gerdemannii]